jgi:hypothetical protein
MDIVMTEEEILFAEKRNSGTSCTNNKDFDRDGYIIVRNIIDPKILYRNVPGSKIRGQINYWGKKLEQFTFAEEEPQVNGSLSTYSHPQYIQSHTDIRLKIEDIIGKKLYNTYYYDRFYFVGQKLNKHTDRDACEISITIHISSNLNKSWPIWIKTPDTEIKKGKNIPVLLNPGDGLIYKGCERPHWRNPLPSRKNNFISKLFNSVDDTYYHQVFFHYVLSDGERAHCAWEN